MKFPRGATFEYVQQAWERGRLAVLPDAWAPRVAARFQARKRFSLRDANLYLLDTTARAEAIRIPLHASDADICHIAAERAAHMMSLAGAAPVKEAGAIRRLLERSAAAWGIPPLGDDISHQGAIARLTDALWWRRRLRAIHAREIEAQAIALGYVHRRAECYCSDVTVQRRAQQKRRNAASLEDVIAMNEAGDEFTLAELAARSVANPRIRRGELMTRIKGFEAVAQGLGHAAEFWTLTCPSRMHARLSKSGEENPHYDGTTPRAAQRYLTALWARIRAAWARRGIAPYGFRISEPHHDGCPHWHLLLFLPVGKLKEARRLFVRYALEDSGTEAGAKANRVKMVAIDWQRGSAAGYVAKYVAKNIDGMHVGTDLEGNPAIESSQRVEAWASTWGIRQFQQVGGPPVGVWRELRRMPEGATGSKALDLARSAADAGNWRAYVEAMGGTSKPVVGVRHVGGRVQQVRAWALYVAKRAATVIDQATGEIRAMLNRYGEAAAARAYGVLEWATGKVWESVRHVWTIRRRAGGGEGAESAPWTRVNNCTGVAAHENAIEGQPGGTDAGTGRQTLRNPSGHRGPDPAGLPRRAQIGGATSGNQRRRVGADSPPGGRGLNFAHDGFAVAP